MIDVAARSAFSLQATQTPSMRALREEGKSLIDHYVSLLAQQRRHLEQLGVGMVMVCSR